MHLSRYKPVEEYVGTPLKLKWVRESTITGDAVTLDIPFKGPKGRANLIINGKKGNEHE